MKQTLIRLILIILFYLLFAFTFHYGEQLSLLAAFVCTYIVEGFIMEKLT